MAKNNKSVLANSPLHPVCDHAHYLYFVLSSFLGSSPAAYWCFLVTFIVYFGVLFGVFDFLTFFLITLEEETSVCQFCTINFKKSRGCLQQKLDEKDNFKHFLELGNELLPRNAHKII